MRAQGPFVARVPLLPRAVSLVPPARNLRKFGHIYSQPFCSNPVKEHAFVLVTQSRGTSSAVAASRYGYFPADGPAAPGGSPGFVGSGGSSGLGRSRFIGLVVFEIPSKEHVEDCIITPGVIRKSEEPLLVYNQDVEDDEPDKTASA